MTLEEAIGHLDGFLAWDQGATDSGVKNDRLRAEVASVIDAASPDDLRMALAHKLRSDLSDEELAQGYGPEDVYEFLDWFESGGYRP